MLAVFLLVFSASEPLSTDPCRGIPLLPSTLDAPGYLQSSAPFHLWGTYLVDATQDSVEITFTLTKNSVLRASVQQNVIDVDLHLIKILPEGPVLRQSRFVEYSFVRM